MYLKQPKSVNTIIEYCEKELMPFILGTAGAYKAKRIVVAWDQYFSESIKKARDTRGDGPRQQGLPEKVNISYLLRVSILTQMF